MVLAGGVGSMMVVVDVEVDVDVDVEVEVDVEVDVDVEEVVEVEVVVEGVVVVEEGVVVEVGIVVVIVVTLSFSLFFSSSVMFSIPSNIYIFDAIMTHKAASNPNVTLFIAKNIINAIKANLPKVLLYKLFNDLGLTINTIINNVNKKQSP